MQKRKYWGSQLEAPTSFFFFFFFFFLQSDRLRKESNGWELKTNVNKVAKTS